VRLFPRGLALGKRAREVVSYNMSQIRSKNTHLEKRLEEILKKVPLHYEKHYEIVGKPDFAFPDRKIAVFADSHFWHGFRWNEAKKEIKTNSDFWIKKIERNMDRDQEVNKALQRLGWKVVRFWEHEIIDNPEECLNRLIDTIKSRKEDK
jgi:DNA mismatch endonuclease (patch repair protein)